MPKMLAASRGAAPGARSVAALALLFAVAALLPLPAAGAIRRGPSYKTVGTVTYNITTIVCDPLSSCNANMQESAAWGNASLAEALTTALDLSLGGDQTSVWTGPYFPYSLNDTEYSTYVLEYNTTRATLLRGLASSAANTTVALAVALPPPLPPSPYQPGPIFRTVGGVSYNITTAECKGISACDKRIKESAVWGNATLAKALAAAVGSALGTGTALDRGSSPWFPASMQYFTYYRVFYWNLERASWVVTDNELAAGDGQTGTVAFVEVMPAQPPSPSPSESPSVEPSVGPNASPSSEPGTSPSSVSPSAEPSVGPSVSPSIEPSASPRVSPGAEPSTSPSSEPSTSPSVLPSVEPSASPNVSPSVEPSASPSASPSVEPSASPSAEPSASPSVLPSVEPSALPSVQPSASPSVEPSTSPSVEPSVEPSTSPSVEPSVEPSASPSMEPSVEPSAPPSVEPSASPSVEPNVEPSTPPSPSPRSSPKPAQLGMPSCTGRAVSITAIDAKTNSQLCSLRKMATRRRNSVAAGSVVTAMPFGDAQGNPASITFTGVSANRMAVASCRCSGSQRRTGACACMPDAVIAEDGASVRLMPLMRAVDSARKAAATIVRLHFNATVPATGKSCAGYVDICSRRLTRGGVPMRGAPACGEFEATRAVRDLTVCSG